MRAFFWSTAEWTRTGRRHELPAPALSLEADLQLIALAGVMGIYFQHGVRPPTKPRDMTFYASMVTYSSPDFNRITPGRPVGSHLGAGGEIS